MTPRRSGPRLVLALLALGVAACSYSFKAGSDASAGEGKPAVAEPGEQSPASKPIGAGDTSEPTAPAASDPEAADPTRVPPPEEPAPVVEPRATAVCRVADASLEALCHRVLDPLAANDLDAWAGQLHDQVVITRPSHHGAQRLEGTQAVRDAVARAGSLRTMLHLRPTDRLVGTLSNDCRHCRRAFVSFEVNTRAGTLEIGVEMSQPPAVISVDVGSRMRRHPLEPHTPSSTLTAPAKAATAPAEDQP
jgi:hypothetical protein